MLISIAFMPASLAALYVTGRANMWFERKNLDALAKSTGSAHEAFRNILAVKSNGCEMYESGRYEKRLNVSYDVCLMQSKIDICVQQYVNLVEKASRVVQLYYAGTLMIQGVQPQIR